MAAVTPLELYVIQKVKKERLLRSISQDKLSLLMGLSKKFVSKVENINRTEKYNLNHLNKIAAVFNCSMRDLIPEKPMIAPIEEVERVIH